MYYKSLTRLSFGTVLLLSCASLHAGEATCPTLDLKTLPVAACATAKAPYRTAPLSKISYIATTPCPTQIGLKKLLQNVFKGSKNYPGTVTNSTAGSFTCSYKLTDEWKKVLNVSDDVLFLDGTLPSANHVSLLNVPMAGFTCPALETKMIDSIKQSKKMEFEKRFSDGTTLTYALQARRLTTASQATHLFTNLGLNTPDLSKLTSIKASDKAKITKDFKMTCRYEHKTGGVKQELILEGSSMGNS